MNFAPKWNALSSLPCRRAEEDGSARSDPEERLAICWASSSAPQLQAAAAVCPSGWREGGVLELKANCVYKTMKCLGMCVHCSRRITGIDLSILAILFLQLNTYVILRTNGRTSVINR